MDQDQLINQFVSITGASIDIARSTLESTNWNIEVATAAYYEKPAKQEPSKPEPLTQKQHTTAVPSSKKKSSTGGIRTLSDYTEKDESNENKQTYFAGGEKSGIQLQAPDKPKASDIVKEVFDSAKKQGAKKPEELKAEKDKFGGSGYQLGNTSIPSKKLQEQQQQKNQSQRVRKVLTFWKNGFTVDDGPLRSYSDPANKDFLSDVHQGIIPRELERESLGKELEISLIDEKLNDYKEPPKPSYIKFSGSGQALGSSNSTPAPIATVDSSETKTFTLNESEPTTSIQIRFFDGTRQVAKFNLTHTVQDVFTFVRAAKDTGGRNFVLKTAVPPPKPLTNMGLTVVEAGLQNSAVVQALV
eukprot:TRINITY_DN11511_c0_g1_i2.p1 TRINITY_DN11511_c0_g1~~TRINITY_DN11511_c0_g1_i2.p1  ORF type:complete len:358 (+),score=95.30 TRINITY_DN11511_c0_g1_i2:63-1136(+)